MFKVCIKARLNDEFLTDFLFFKNPLRHLRDIRLRWRDKTLPDDPSCQDLYEIKEQRIVFAISTKI